MEHYHVKNSFFRNGIDYWHFVTIQFQSELDQIESAKMPFEQELNIYLRSRFTLIVLVTPEAERALAVVKVVCDRFYSSFGGADYILSMLLSPAELLYFLREGEY